VRYGRQRFLGASATLALVGSVSVRVWLIPILITNFSTPHIVTSAESAPIFACIWDTPYTLVKRATA